MRIVNGSDSEKKIRGNTAGDTGNGVGGIFWGGK